MNNVKVVLYSTMYFFINMVVFINAPRYLFNKPYYFDLYIDMLIKFFLLVVVVFLFYRFFLKKSIVNLTVFMLLGLIFGNIIHDLFFNSYVNNSGGIEEILIGYMISAIIYFLLISFLLLLLCIQF